MKIKNTSMETNRLIGVFDINGVCKSVHSSPYFAYKKCEFFNSKSKGHYINWAKSIEVFTDISETAIIDTIVNYFGLTIEQINNKTRKREIVEVRQILHYFLKNHTKSSYSKIGKKIGDKDHATVIHSLKTINNLIDSSPEFAAKIEDLKLKILQYEKELQNSSYKDSDSDNLNNIDNFIKQIFRIIKNRITNGPGK